VYGFVRQSSGHVKIYSEVGEGTTVKVYLPRFVGEHRPQQTEPPRHAAGAGGAETILIVEDDDALRSFAVETFNDLGYHVLEAANGQAALEVLDRRDNIVLLFTDVVMPGGLNGRQLADEARRRRPGLKVLFTTGYSRNAIVHHGRLDPGVQMISKPFSFNELGAKVRAILDGD
jgi:CheY-like chemotaxis protein